MKTKTHHARSATTAIVAALALGSTALAAQTVTPPADPPIVQPETSPATGPVVIVPDAQTAPTTTEAPATTTSTPVLVSPVAVPQSTTRQSAPVQSETAPPPAAQSATAARQAPAPSDEAAAPAAQRSAAQASEAQPAAPPPQEDTAFIPPAAPVAAVGTVPAVPPAATADPAPPAGKTANQVALLTGIFFIVLLLGLALFTYAYWRRRSSAAAVPTIVRPTVSQKPEPESAAQTALTLETAASIAHEHPDAPRERPASVDNVAPIRSVPAKQAPVESAPVPLPTAIPDKFEERDALIKQMVEAEPDKANPFRSRKARQRRARLILQSLARKFDGREPWIDLSEYTRNWPMGRRQNSPA